MSRRSASSAPDQSRRVCRSDSWASSRAEVFGMTVILPGVGATPWRLPLRTRVSPPPTGLTMSITTTTHLNFRVSARVAMEFQLSVFGGQISLVSHADAGYVPAPAEAEN